MFGSGGGWVYSFIGSCILRVSFRRLIGRYGNLVVISCIVIRPLCWWMWEYISSWIVFVGLIIF